ncbi:MAG: hypothetical protein K5686_04355 [Lachnospiraceae bacterium]|nr:hypothetical protein [Lachnospiraceae bacterium]
MEQVYLGLLSDLFNKIFKKIIQPVLTFVSGILESIFSWVFDNILKPLLINFIIPVLKGFIEIIFEMLAALIYSIYVLLLKVIDTAQTLFNVFGGIDTIVYKKKKMNILEFFFSQKSVQTAAWILIALSIVLLLAFAVVAVIKSVGDLGDEQRPVTKVLHATFQGFTKLIMIPIVCLFMIMLANVVLSAVNTAIITAQTGKTETTTVARTLFVMTTFNAAQNDKYNAKTAPKDFKVGVDDELRKKYYYKDANDSFKFDQLDQIEKDFKYSKIDYLVGFGAGLLLLYVLCSGVFKFINRMYNILILFILAPFFAASQPLDDGEKFKSWKDLFVGQLFSAYGSVVAMQIYLLIMPSVLAGKLGFGLSTEGDYVIKVLFLLGGAFSVQSAGPLITGLIDSTSASMERQQDMAFYGGLRSAYAWGKEIKGAFAVRKNMAQRQEQQKQMLAKARAEGAASVGGGKGGKALPGGGSGNKGPGGISKQATGKEVRKAALAQAQKKAKDTAIKNGTYKPPKKPDPKAPKPGVTGRFLGGLFTVGKDAQGKRRVGLNLGKHFNFGMQKDGTYKSNIFGFGKKYDKDGNLVKKSMPFVRMTKDADGKFKVSKVKISKGLQFRKAETLTTDAEGKITGRKQGGWFCSDFSPLNMHKAFDQSTGKVETLGSMFMSYQRVEGPDGKVSYVRKEANVFGKTLAKWDVDKNGKEYNSYINAGVTDLHYGVNSETGERELTKVTSFGGKSIYEHDLPEQAAPGLEISKGADFSIDGEKKGHDFSSSSGSSFSISGEQKGHDFSSSSGSSFTIGGNESHSVGGNTGAPTHDFGGSNIGGSGAQTSVPTHDFGGSNIGGSGSNDSSNSGGSNGGGRPTRKKK